MKNRLISPESDGITKSIADFGNIHFSFPLLEKRL